MSESNDYSWRHQSIYLPPDGINLRIWRKAVDGRLTFCEVLKCMEIIILGEFTMFMSKGGKLVSYRTASIHSFSSFEESLEEYDDDA